MSTRWQLAAKLENGRVGCIYVHSDGYPEHALKVLQQHYTDPDKIARLIERGDHLSVAPEIEKCEPFCNRPDEEWDEIKPTYGDDLKAVADAHLHGDEEYRYFWDGQQWALVEIE